MLLKFATIFLANIFYYSKIIFKLKKRDTRLSHFGTPINKIYDIYFKIHGGLTDLEFCHSINNLLFFLNF